LNKSTALRPHEEEAYIKKDKETEVRYESEKNVMWGMYHMDKKTFVEIGFVGNVSQGQKNIGPAERERMSSKRQ
jgi:hypothetical protein